MKSALCILFVSIPLMAAESVPRGRGHTQRRVADIADAVPFPLLIRGRAFQVLGSNPRFDKDNGESAYE
jgi:hypothetical protein